MLVGCLAFQSNRSALGLSYSRPRQLALDFVALAEPHHRLCSFVSSADACLCQSKESWLLFCLKSSHLMSDCWVLVAVVVDAADALALSPPHYPNERGWACFHMEWAQVGLDALVNGTARLVSQPFVFHRDWSKFSVCCLYVSSPAFALDNLLALNHSLVAAPFRAPALALVVDLDLATQMEVLVPHHHHHHHHLHRCLAWGLGCFSASGLYHPFALGPSLDRPSLTYPSQKLQNLPHVLKTTFLPLLHVEGAKFECEFRSLAVEVGPRKPKAAVAFDHDDRDLDWPQLGSLMRIVAADAALGRCIASWSQHRTAPVEFVWASCPLGALCLAP